MSDLKYWLALIMTPDIGPIRAKKLISIFKTPKKIFNADFKDLSAIDGITQKAAKKITSFSEWDIVEKYIDIISEKNIKTICLNDSDYPVLLKETSDAPVVLFIRGDIMPNDRFSLAIVGSRKMTSYGALVAERFSEELSSAGMTIVSGMARGIDSVAHRGAIKANGRTIAVLGSGVDVVYPPENKNLFEKIIEHGCIMSEFLPGTGPDKENFPKRNRIISGLSLGVLVVEAVSDSGALITAKFANDYGREVFAIPGAITSKNSKGTNNLIKEGALLVQQPDDILEELAPVLKGFIKTEHKVKIELSNDEKILCNLLSGEPRQIDDIARQSAFPASKVLAILLGLELKGIVKQITGKRFYLA
ncbi:MAG: DNA-protecting protein DprA [Nitrospirae bacterium]|jgi:DNA processing protein|nr:DNA-protecting protein DprA [Nitrospirota bacterium]